MSAFHPERTLGGLRIREPKLAHFWLAKKQAHCCEEGSAATDPLYQLPAYAERSNAKDQDLSVPLPLHPKPAWLVDGPDALAQLLPYLGPASRRCR
jgi:hypothetical protein